MYIDTYKHQGQRNRLITELINKGVDDEAILAAIMKIPRHYFINSDFEHMAYEDKALRIDCNQTISQPHTVAIQTQLLQLTGNEKVLEIGTGSGYQSAILCALGSDLYSIEIHPELVKKAKQILKILGYAPKIHVGNGHLGWPQANLFDKIIVTAGADKIPPSLLQQLNINGCLVIPVRNSNDSFVMKKIIKNKNDNYTITDHGTFKFVPFVLG